MIPLLVAGGHPGDENKCGGDLFLKRGAAGDIIRGVATLSPDTSPEAERVQIELLRNASVARRFELARALSEMAIGLALKAIRASMPGADDRAVMLRFVAVHHGEGLAEALDRFLERRGE